MLNEEIENFLWRLYPITIIMDRYCGTYSGGDFTAWLLDNDKIPEAAQDSDVECREFWYQTANNYLIGKGKTPQEAYDELINKVRKLATEIKDGLYDITNYEELAYYSDYTNSEEYEKVMAIIREFNNRENGNNG